MTSPVRVVVTTDELYAMPTAACIRSVIDNHHPDRPLHIAVLASALQPATTDRLRRSWTSIDHDVTITFTDVDLSRYAALPTISAVGATVTTGVYARLLIGELLPLSWDRVIYLDSDTIARHPLADLWTVDLAGAILGAVRDDYVPTISSPYGVPTRQRQRLDPGLPYFNSGVLLIDLTAWRHNRIGEQATRYLAEADEINLFDQDALNAVLCGRWRPLDTVWNVTSYWRKEHRRTGRYQTILDDARIRHFAGSGKPWDLDPLPEVPDTNLFLASLARTYWKPATTRSTGR
jgi:lipopolysaccharide biosynthesis glycosyltransferase